MSMDSRQLTIIATIFAIMLGDSDASKFTRHNLQTAIRNITIDYLQKIVLLCKHLTIAICATS